MKKLMYTLAMGVLMAFMGGQTFAQTADVQIIHNSPDPSAATVDIYLNGGMTPAVDDFSFRDATDFLALPAGSSIDIGIAPGTSTGPADIIATIPFTLTPNETYVLIASGVLNPAAFAANPGGISTAFSLEAFTPAQQTGTAPNVDLLVYHGSTDAPEVDVVANGGMMPLIDNAEYKEYVGYASVPAAQYVLDVTPSNDNSTIVASYFVDLSGLSGGSAVVFASGFFDPTQNGNGAAFGLFAALADGTVLELQAVGNARAQVIHNAADPNAASVDVYINWIKDSLKVDDFAFRTATGFVDLPAGVPLSIAVAGPNSTSSADAIATFPATVMDGETYAIVANGVLDPMMFAANPGGANTGFGLLIEAGVREDANTSGNLDIKVLHGATDAPAVGVNANGGAVVPSASYSQFTGYLEVPAAEYRIDVTGDNDPTTLVAPFYVDAAGLADQATLIFASGFLDPTANQNGEAFGLFAALPDGSVVPLTGVGNARGQVIHNAADPNAATVDIYVNMLADTLFLDDFDFRTATAFVDLPTGYEIDIVVAGPNSTSIADAIATIPATLTDGESYHLIANGVLDPMMFAANPDMVATAFGIFAATGAQEESGNANEVDLRVFHGATDAPTVDVLAFGSSGALVDNAAYTDATPHLALPAADYNLAVALGDNPGTIVGTFNADASTLGGGAGIILASGFLDPTANQNGEAFGLLLVLPDGTANLLSNITNLEDLSIDNTLLNIYPNPVAIEAIIDYSLDKPGDVNIEVMDMAGRTVMQKSYTNVAAGAQNWVLPVGSLSAGMHTVVVSSESTRSVKKIVVQK